MPLMEENREGAHWGRKTKESGDKGKKEEGER